MSNPEIIDIKLSNTSPTNSPRLSVVGSASDGLIKLNNLPPLEVSEKKSVNFGPGADLLINQKIASKSNSPRSDIKLSELQSLEPGSGSPKKVGLSAIARSRLVASIDTTKSPLTTGNIKLNISPTGLSPPPAQSSPPSTGSPKEIKVGAASKDAKNETWDGFKRFNEIPVNPSIDPPEKPKMSQEQELRLKFSFIRKLEALDKQGITISKKYTMEDKLAEMQGEYEMIKADIGKRNSVKFQGKMLMAFVSGIEFLNGKFDPFDIKLDGWGEAVGENIEEYDEVFGELHEKYGGKAKMAPELKLLFMLGGSAAMLHMTNTMFKSSMPGMDDILRQNPELMQQFTHAAAQSMNTQNPGFGNFMSGMMPGGPPTNMMPGGNPAGMMPGGVMPPMGSPPGPPRSELRTANRPDLNAARGIPPKTSRRDMTGPSDISDILSGIKTKKVNIRQTQNPDTISVSELKEMPVASGLPQKSKRKPRSERNTINLNI